MGSEMCIRDRPSAISIDEIVAEQRVDSFCQTALANAGKFTSFFEDEDGILRRRLPFGRKLTPVVLPSTLRPRALRLMHHVPIAGHPGQTRMYANMRRSFYWPHMAVDIFETVKNCASCARERVSNSAPAMAPFIPSHRRDHWRTSRSTSLDHSAPPQRGTR